MRVDLGLNTPVLVLPALPMPVLKPPEFARPKLPVPMLRCRRCPSPSWKNPMFPLPELNSLMLLPPAEAADPDLAVAGIDADVSCYRYSRSRCCEVPVLQSFRLSLPKFAADVVAAGVAKAQVVVAQICQPDVVAVCKPAADTEDPGAGVMLMLLPPMLTPPKR